MREAPGSLRGRPRLVPMPVPVHRSGLWLLLGAFALLGLLAMHGLGGHGGTHALGSESHPAGTHAHPDHVHSDSAAQDGRVDSAGMQVIPGAVPAVAAAGHDCRDCADQHALAMALCLAVLTALALAVMFARHPAGAGMRWLPASSTALRTELRRARGPDPPCLIVLSIQRC